MKKISTILAACALALAGSAFAWANSKPVLAPIGGPSQLTKNVSYDFTGSWTDADPGDTHTVQWKWGDVPDFPSPPPFVTETSPTTASHTYTKTGTFTIRFTVRDSGTPTGAAFATKMVTVTN